MDFSSDAETRVREPSLSPWVSSLAFCCCLSLSLRSRESLVRETQHFVAADAAHSRCVCVSERTSDCGCLAREIVACLPAAAAAAAARDPPQVTTIAHRLLRATSVCASAQQVRLLSADTGIERRRLRLRLRERQKHRRSSVVNRDPPSLSLCRFPLAWLLLLLVSSPKLR